MNLLDLTWPLADGSPVFPGDPPVRLADAGVPGCRVTRLSLGSHAGTHIDAPAHVFPGGRTLEQYPPARFAGTAAVLASPGDLDRAAGADFLLVRTGWDRRWGAPDYFTAYPPLDPGLAAAIAAGGFRGVGLDTPGPDRPDALDCHRLLLGADVLILENLRRLDRLPPGRFRLWALPLAVAGADGAPVRAVAYWEE